MVNPTIKDFIYSLTLSGFTVQKHGVTFHVWNHCSQAVIQRSENGGWEIGLAPNGWNADLVAICSIAEFYSAHLAH